MNIGTFSKLVKITLPLIILLNINIQSNSAVLTTAKASAIEKYNAIPEVSETIPFEAFDLAFKAYMQTPLSNNKILTIIDYTKPSTEDRFYVLDIKANKLLYKTKTAHGINTGNKYARKFSNISRSKQSSLGFFKTGVTYDGKHGFSLRLHGMESGINDNAYDRAIVIHKADYMSDSFLKKHGRAGRSWGCPALQEDIYEEVINTIKNGSGLFIYSEDPSYKANSRFVESI